MKGSYRTQALVWGGAPMGGSGLWNSNHCKEVYDSAFLDLLERLAAAIRPLG